MRLQVLLVNIETGTFLENIEWKVALRYKDKAGIWKALMEGTNENGEVAQERILNNKPKDRDLLRRVQLLVPRRNLEWNQKIRTKLLK